MALVGVEDLGLGGAGEAGVDAQGADAADAEQDLLPEPVLRGAAVQPVGDLAVVVGVALDVGVEQQQRDATDLRHPDLGQEVGAAGHRDRDGGPGAVLVAEQADRQLVGIEDGVLLQLPALSRERLLEVAGVVEQTDAYEGYAEVAGGLEMVAGEDAEAAGVLREHRADAELRREVGDPRGCLLAGPPGVPPLAGEVGVEVGLDRSQPVQEGLVAAELLEPLGDTAPSSRTGSRLVDSQISGSTSAKTSWVGGCQDHLRFPARSPSAERAGGRTGRTVNRRIARTRGR